MFCTQTDTLLEMTDCFLLQFVLYRKRLNNERGLETFSEECTTEEVFEPAFKLLPEND